MPLTARFGYAAPEAEQAYSRAQELCNQVGDAAPAYPPIYGLFRTRLLAGDYDTAEQIARQLADIAASEPERQAWTVGAARATGSVAFYRGVDHALAHDFPFWTGWARVLLAWGAGRRGDPAAPSDIRLGIEQWQAQGSRLEISYFHALVADTELHLGDLDGARSTLERAIDVAEEMGEYFWMPEMLERIERTRAQA